MVSESCLLIKFTPKMKQIAKAVTGSWKSFSGMYLIGITQVQFSNAIIIV